MVFGRILADYLNENKFEDKEIDFKITDEKIDKEKTSEIIFERIREDEKAKSISN